MLAPLLLAAVLSAPPAREPLTAPRPWWVAAARPAPGATADELWATADWLDGLWDFDAPVPATATARLRRAALARATPRRRAELLALGGEASLLPDLARLFDDFGLRTDPDAPAEPDPDPPGEPADPAAVEADERAAAELLPAADTDGDGRAEPGEVFAYALGEALTATFEAAADERERALRAAVRVDPGVLAAWFGLVLNSDDAAVRDRAVAELRARDGGNLAAHLAAAIALRRTARDAPDAKWIELHDERTGEVDGWEPDYSPATVAAIWAAVARAAAAGRIEWYAIYRPAPPAGLRYPPVGRFVTLGVVGEPVPPSAAAWIIEPYPDEVGVFAPALHGEMRSVLYDLTEHAGRLAAAGDPDAAAETLAVVRAFARRVMRDAPPDTLNMIAAFGAWRHATEVLAGVEAARGNAARSARLRAAYERARGVARWSSRLADWTGAIAAAARDPAVPDGGEDAADRAALRRRLRTGGPPPGGAGPLDVWWHVLLMAYGFR